MENVCHVGWGRPGSASVHSRVPYSDNQTMSRDRWQLSFVVAGGSDCMWIILYLWCCSPKHHHFCIAIIGRAVLPAFLIPLVKMLYLVIGTTLQDRILIAQKLTKLLILTHCQFGHGSLLLDIACIQPPKWRLILPLHRRTLNRVCTSTGRAFLDHWTTNKHYLERSHKTKNFN